MSGDSSKSPLRNRFFGVVQALLAWVVVFLAPQFVVGMALPVLTPLLPQAGNVRHFILYCVVEALALAFTLVFVKAYGWQLHELGLNRPHWRHLVKALAGYGVYLCAVVVALLTLRLSFNLPDDTQFLAFQKPQQLELVLVFIALVVVVPFAEELIFRGLFFAAVRRHTSFWWTAVLVSAVFAFVHDTLLVSIDVFVLSLVLCYLRERTASLWPGLWLHALKNMVAFFALFIYNGT